MFGFPQYTNVYSHPQKLQNQPQQQQQQKLLTQLNPQLVPTINMQGSIPLRLMTWAEVCNLQLSSPPIILKSVPATYIQLPGYHIAQPSPVAMFPRPYNPI